MKYLFLIVISALLYSCGSSDKTENKNVTAAKELFNQFNKHDWKAVASLYADSVEMKDPDFGSRAVKKTRKDIESHYTKLGQQALDVRDSIIAVYPSTNGNIIVEFISTGNIGSDNEFAMPICTILKFNDKGKIEKDYTYYDKPEEIFADE